MNNNQKRRDEIIDKNFLTDDYRGVAELGALTISTPSSLES